MTTSLNFKAAQKIKVLAAAIEKEGCCANIVPAVLRLCFQWQNDLNDGTSISTVWIVKIFSRRDVACRLVITRGLEIDTFASLA